MRRKPRALIGTSGWVYPHWRGRFYPEGLPQPEWLKFYARSFPTAEINASFYRLPSERTVKGWHANSPRRFVFAVKGSRFITHIKRLKDAEEPLRTFASRISLLGEKLGPVLWQLPPNLKRDDERLSGFLELLPKGWLHAFEFRHPSWFCDEVLDLLARHNVALCIFSRPDFPCPEVATTGWVYIRMHGSESLYSSCYTLDELRSWAERIERFLSDGKDVYVYFNNDVNAYAVQNGLVLMKLLGEWAPKRWW
ncbi:MAG TPA: DUF72 domain-containing protein [Armatimonadetes bacterium]|nr:DUF72 domain-containing protein [Armatimonadota bacterium]